ncbi:hypothetical protein F7734_53525 [Scytonema sp. UIC 10036]|uniref:hypothetical protein n=1 Tax=Scytonema sp. UIC 10036 TaxID=2304196 RepID=UPI0012DAC701|nr:hypothetical protein [Scytonema sp. UIC 10036]MUH00629.1 hypothetical protein [Scytonema sp. UIC 10036]
MRKALLIVVASTLVSSPVLAQQIPTPSQNSNDWQHVTTNTAGSIYYVDKATAARYNNGNVSFWVRLSTPIGVVGSFNVGECSTGVQRKLWLFRVDNDGKLVVNGKGSNNPEYLQPGSAGATVLRAVCDGL